MADERKAIYHSPNGPIPVTVKRSGAHNSRVIFPDGSDDKVPNDKLEVGGQAPVVLSSPPPVPKVALSPKAPTPAVAPQPLSESSQKVEPEVVAPSPKPRKEKPVNLNYKAKGYLFPPGTKVYIETTDDVGIYIQPSDHIKGSHCVRTKHAISFVQPSSISLARV